MLQRSKLPGYKGTLVLGSCWLCFSFIFTNSRKQFDIQLTSAGLSYIQPCFGLELFPQRASLSLGENFRKQFEVQLAIRQYQHLQFRTISVGYMYMESILLIELPSVVIWKMKANFGKFYFLEQSHTETSDGAELLINFWLHACLLINRKSLEPIPNQ